MYDSVVCFMFIVKCSTINMKYKRNYNGVLQIINKIRSVINITWQYFYSTMQITHTHAENANFQAVNKNKQMLLSWSLIAYLSIFFLCIAISYEIIETFYTNTNLSFLRTGLTTILNCLVSYKTKKEHSYEFLSYCKIPIPQREFSIVIGSIPSGTQMLGIDKDHSPDSASLDVTNVFYLLWLNVFFMK